MIQIVNKKYYKGLNGIYIGRGKNSPLGNPYPTKPSKFIKEIYSSEESLKLYRIWLWQQIKSRNQLVLTELEKIATMDNVDLICWCVDKKGKGRCHGFIIRDCILWMKEKNLEKQF